MVWEFSNCHPVVWNKQSDFDDHSIFSIFYHHFPQECIYLIVYVDNIIIIGNDEGIVQLKQYLAQNFRTKKFGHLRYFLGIELTQRKDGLVISQKICSRHSKSVKFVDPTKR